MCQPKLENMENGELKIKNNMFFWDTVKSEYMKACEKYPVDFSKEFDIRGVILFNNPLVKGEFWHNNNGSGFVCCSVGYDISVPPNTLYRFQTRIEAEKWLKKTKIKKITDKTKVKIKRSFIGEGLWRSNFSSPQLDPLYFNKPLEFKKTTIEVLKWYE